MPFNENGRFIRVHNWTEDKQNNIPITASRMDAEDDGFATGLSQTFLRDGSVALTGDLKAGNNKLTGLKNGTESTDAATIGQLNIVQGNAVLLTGDQTVAGVKTFTSSPVVPTVSADDSSTKVATTAWVNTTGNNVVHLTDDETITGVKTFIDKLINQESEYGYDPYIFTKHALVYRGVAPTYTVGGNFEFVDKNNNHFGGLNIIYDTDRTIRSSLFAVKPQSGGGEPPNATISIIYPYNGSAYTFAPTPTDTTGSNGTQIATTGWVNSVGNNVVHLSGSETITGAKTFTSNVTQVSGSPREILKNTDCVKGIVPASNEAMCVQFKDSNNNLLGTVQTNYETTKKTIIQLRVYKAQSASDSANISMGIGYDASGNPYSWAPTPLLDSSSTDYNGQIVNVGYLNGSNSSVVHKTGNETIAGNKTLSGSATFQTEITQSSASPVVYLKNTSITKGTAPSEEPVVYVRFRDSTNRDMGALRYGYGTNKESKVSLRANKANASGDTAVAELTLTYPASGNPYVTAPASDINGSIVTTVNKSKARDGYFELGNGLIIQWGYTADVSGNTTITLPKAFSSNNYAVTFGINVSGDSYAPCIVSKTSTNFVYWCISNRKSYWIAIGY